MTQLSYPKSHIWDFSLLKRSHICLGLLALLWFASATKHFLANLDNQVFYLLNGSLAFSPSWAKLWAIFNHSNETWMNFVVMLGVNILAIFYCPKEKRLAIFSLVLYYWLFFQLGLLISHGIFKDWLHIERASPSAVLTPAIRLSELFNNPLLKDYSDNSFPAGHAFVLIYWACFTSQYANNFFKYLAWVIALFLCIPRIISGAHWFSDIFLTAAISWALFSWATATPFAPFIINKMTNLLAAIRKKSNEF